MRRQHRLETTFLVLVILLFSACKEVKQKPPAPVVSITKSHQRDVEIFGEYVGRTRAFQQVEIRARVSGFLQKVAFKQGSKVKKDDLLYIIDPRQYNADYNRAQAQLELEKAGALKAQRDLERLKPLYKENAVSQQDYDNAIAAKAYADASVNRSKAELNRMALQLSFTKIKAPTDGFITESLVDLGTLVGGGSGETSLLATIVKTDPIYVNFSMTALDYLASQRRNVGGGDSTNLTKNVVTITLPDDTEYKQKGSLNFTEHKLNPETGTYSVQAVFPNQRGVLLPGQPTRVKLLLDIVKDAVVVPRKSVQIEDGGAYLFLVRKDTTVERRFVELGPEIDNEIIIERGLNPQETVISEGMHKIKAGQKVKIAEPEAEEPEENQKETSKEKSTEAVSENKAEKEAAKS
ncbi:efflux RND transporter periplasmic adaptor subunit [Sediminitomix flava]|uniref:Membrane fusion protein (Multidrug efflux system) n=1 Tax=Sediminitomix flava TaxID=379075 RepID=A0A315ZU02_SEDFL|nr:efflux RND transporter periplasmic adaptor subunit [Sediminitomix flava]PWJ39159.1 membrane fusion protein (multidrug efflux system) [Sediminitomix flava]